MSEPDRWRGSRGRGRGERKCREEEQKMRIRGEKTALVTLVGGRCEDGGGASQNSGSPAPNQTQNRHGNTLAHLSGDRNFQILSYYK